MTLTILVSVFLILLGAGLLLFATFFVINKIYLNKLIKLMKRYNKLATSIHGINFFKIEVLIKNNLPIKIDLDNLKQIYGAIEANAIKIHDNLIVITDEVNAMDLKTASRHLKTCDVDLTKAEHDLNYVKKQINQYTSYGDAVDAIVHQNEEIYEELLNFYRKNVKYADHFKPINDVFKQISLTIANIPDNKVKFDFKKTTNAILDLRRKLISLTKGLDIVVKYQVILTWLENTLRTSSITISKTFRDIDTKDSQIIMRKMRNLSDYYGKFKNAYLKFDLKEAKKNAILASQEASAINKFIYVNTKTQDLIDTSLNEINKQTIAILSNKNEIQNSLNTISKYFLKDPKISETFKKIASDIDVIDKLAVSSKVITSKTYSQKIEAIRQIANISKKIYDKKESVSKSISYINETLSQIIQIISNLNDLYIYFYQLLTIVKKYSTDDNLTKDIEALINNNLGLLNSYAKMVIEQEHPDYSSISRNVYNMNQTVDQLTKKIRTIATLKSYATKLMVYCNRFRGKKENAPIFATATKQFKAKQYDKCIETLLAFAKKAKRSQKD